MKYYETIGNPIDADCVIGHSFGTSIDANSPNHKLGELLLAYSEGRPLIADRTLVNAMPNGDVHMAHIVEGDVTNLKAQGVGTWGTLLEAKTYMDEHDLHSALMIAQAFHISRVVRQAANDKIGITSIVPTNLPSDFDRHSKQPWTRSAVLWVPFNTFGSQLLKRRGQL